MQSQRDWDAQVLKNQRKLDIQYKTNLAVQLLDAMQSTDDYKAWKNAKSALYQEKKTDKAIVKKYEEDVQQTQQAKEAVLKIEAELSADAPRIAELKAKLWVTESVEELQEALKQYILQRSAAIAHEVREHNQWTDREVERIDEAFPNKDNTTAVERKEVHFVGEPEKKEMKYAKVPWDTLLVQPMTLDGVEWTGLKIPAGIKKMKVADLSPELMGKENNKWFPQMAMDVTVQQALDSDWLVLAKHNTKADDGKAKVNIETYNTSADTDVVRECLLKGTKPMGIVQNLVLREIIKQWLWDKYVNFMWYKADSNEYWNQEKREMISEIDDYTELNLWEYVDVWNGKTYVVRNWWLYRDKNNNLNAFIRGYGADGGCIGGVASLDLYWDVGGSPDYIGFRSWL